MAPALAVAAQGLGPRGPQLCLSSALPGPLRHHRSETTLHNSQVTQFTSTHAARVYQGGLLMGSAVASPTPLWPWSAVMVRRASSGALLFLVSGYL